MKHRWFLIYLLVLMLTAGVTGATYAQADRSEKDGGTLVLSLKETLDTLDPFVSALGEPIRVLGMVCETLVSVDQNLVPQPHLVESWTVSEDELTVSFKLKEGIFFHDGTPLNADSVIDYLVNYHIPLGFSAWQLEPVEEMVVTGEYTFDFHLSTPYPTLFVYLADPWNIIQSPSAYEKYGDRYGFDALVGTGPYVFEEWVRGERIVVTRNEDYNHGPDYISHEGPAYLDKIIYRVVPEAITRVSELRFGDVDLVWTVPETLLPEVEADDNIDLILRTSARVVWLGCNQARPLMQDPKLREALNYAIDRQAVMDATFHGYGEHAYSIISPTTTLYWEGIKDYASDIYRYDADKSRQLLDDAGWILPAGKTIREKDGAPLRLNLVTFNLTRYKIPAEVVMAMLADVGIAVDLEVYDSAAAHAKLKAGEYDIATAGYAYPLGEVQLSSIVGTSGIPHSNYYAYSNPEIDAALQMINLGSLQVRLDAAAVVQRLVVDDFVVIPLLVRQTSIAVSPNVGGLDEISRHPWWSEYVIAMEMYRVK